MSATQTADPKARRRAVRLLVIATLIGALLIMTFERYGATLFEWLISDPDRAHARLRMFFLLSGALCALPPLGLAAYLRTLARRVRKAGQYPLPGQSVLRDTPVLEGEPALGRARAFEHLAAGLISVALVLAFVWWRIFSMLEAGL
ncbi:MAG: hypothetical protein PVG91_08880 [Gammaproteobacteria bacterium]|jgi:hypothetical protein